jgi:hypothetical protein
MNEELAELAGSGATALVTAIGTDFWQEAKRLMSGVLAHTRSGRRRELAVALGRASTATRGAVDASALDYWTEALRQVLDRDPALAEDVAAMARLRHPGRSEIVIQMNSATDSGEVFAVQRGIQRLSSGPESRRSEERR